MPRLSLIIPVLNEEARLPRALEALEREAPGDEVVVVDGGSTDASVTQARDFCDGGDQRHFLLDDGGLASQLRSGAALARGDVLVFAYVDTRLPVGWRDAILTTMEDPEVCGGAFQLGFEDPGLVFRFIGKLANLRTACGLGPFGDQAIFACRRAYLEVGGHRDEVLLEDLDLVRRLRRRARFRIVKASVATSTRRWRQQGLLRTTLRSWGFLLGHHLPVFRGQKSAYQKARTRYR